LEGLDRGAADTLNPPGSLLMWTHHDRGATDTAIKKGLT
jgi:hypothetical protein